MSSVNSTSNSYNIYTQNNTQVSSTQGQHKVHHHHKKTQEQDSSNFSKDGIQALSDSDQNSASTGAKSPLDNLVANGTITQDQENSIKSAFKSARQANLAGTYGSKQANPISNLVSSGTITEDQANAIKSSFQAIAQASQGTQQVSDAQGQTKVHHHHHHKVQQVQGINDAANMTTQTTNSSQDQSNT